MVIKMLSRKVLSICICAVILISGCSQNSLQKESDSTEIIEISAEKPDKAKELLYEYKYEDLFVIKKFSDNSYIVAKKMNTIIVIFIQKQIEVLYYCTTIL